MNFKVGTSKVDITPNYGSPTRRWNLHGEGSRITDIKWPLYARTVAISDGKSITTITSMEVACLYKYHMDRIRSLINDMSKIPIDNIILHSTHQHSDSFIEYEPSYDIFEINDIAFDLDYIRNLMRKVATSVCLAVQSMAPAVIAYCLGEVKEGIAACRRVLTDNGEIRWRSSRPAPKLRGLPRGHIDPEVGVIVLNKPDGTPLATLYNYACHPSAAGGDSPPVCSADFPGYASDMIESCYGGTAMFLHGCSGDINPSKYVRGDSFDHDDRIADAKRMGQILAGEVLKTIGKIQTEDVEYINVSSKECRLPVQKEAGNVELSLDNAKKALKEWKKSDADPRTALRKYIISLKIDEGGCPVTMFALCINDVSIGFIPGEPFTEFGEKIKKSSTGLTLVAATCGEDPFYIPNRKAFDRGGYETGYIASPGTGPTLVNEITQLLSDVGKE